MAQFEGEDTLPVFTGYDPDFEYVKDRDSQLYLEEDVRVIARRPGLSLGIGFAIIENTVFMVSYSDRITILAALFRGIGAGMMHGITTMAVGFGMSFILLKRKLFVTGTLAFLSMAITYHSIYNMLVQSDYQLFGFLIPIMTFSGFFAFYRRHKDRINDAP